MTGSTQRPDAGSVAGRRVLVVGASSGIGACVTEQLVTAGAEVAGAARRAERIPAGVRLSCDLRVPADCTRVVDAAVVELGGLDTLVFAAGTAPLIPLRSTTAAVWGDVLGTNVVGASLVTAAAMAHLAVSPAGGSALYLASNAADLSNDAAPGAWPGLGAYAASKAALETMVRTWEAEQPAVRFVTYVVHPTLTPMADQWDPELATALLGEWERAGLLKVAELRQPAEVAAEIVARL